MPAEQQVQRIKAAPPNPAIPGMRRSRGVSLIETAMVALVVLVLAAISVPAVTRTLKTHRLSTAATSLSDLLQRARYEAVKRNTNTYLRVAQQGSMWAFYIDIDNSGTITTGDPELLLSQDARVDTSTNPPALTSMGYSGATRFPDLGATPALDKIQFNSRGTVVPSGSPTVYVICLSIPGQQRYGYRAVAVTPFAKSKVWTAAASGSWRRQ